MDDNIPERKTVKERFEAFMVEQDLDNYLANYHREEAGRMRVLMWISYQRAASDVIDFYRDVLQTTANNLTTDFWEANETDS